MINFPYLKVYSINYLLHSGSVEAPYPPSEKIDHDQEWSRLKFYIFYFIYIKMFFKKIHYHK